MSIHVLGPSSNRHKNRSQSKIKKPHKKSYSKKIDTFGKRLSGTVSSKNKKSNDFSSPYKFDKRNNDFLSPTAISSHEYSNYIKNKHLNLLMNNFSLESSTSKPNNKHVPNAFSIGNPLHQQKLSISKKPLNKNVSAQRKKKQRSKTKTEKSVVFMMPGQQIKNQYIHY